MQQIDVPKFHVPSHIKNFRCCARVELTDCAGKLVSRHMSNCRLASPPVRTSVGEPGWGVSLISGNNRWFWEFEKSEPKNHRFPEFQRPPKNQPGFTKEPEGTRRVSLGYLTLQNPRTAVMSSIIRGFDFF